MTVKATRRLFLATLLRAGYFPIRLLGLSIGGTLFDERPGWMKIGRAVPVSIGILFVRFGPSLYRGAAT